MAAGVGYKQHSDNVGKSGADGIICADVAFGTPAISAVDCNTLSVSGALMHVPTGLYAHASWSRTEDDNRKVVFGAVGAPANVKDKDEHWYIQVGIEKNFFGIGKSTFYGEYGEYSTGAVLSNVGGVQANDIALLGVVHPRIANSEVTQWGFGYIQGIDAAAMDLYVAYKHFDADLTVMNLGNVIQGKVSPKDWDAVIMGGIIRF